MVRLPEPVTRMPSTAVFRHGFIEFVQQIVGGLDGAAGNPPVIGEHQRSAAERRTPEFGMRGAKRFQDWPVAGIAQSGQLQTDSPDIQTDIDAHCPSIVECNRRINKVFGSESQIFASIGKFGR